MQGDLRTDETDHFFDAPMHVVDVQGWPQHLIRPDRPYTEPVPAPPGATLRVQRIHPHDRRAVPPPDGTAEVVPAPGFSLNHSGNRTLLAPKRSWKVELDGGARVGGLAALALKAMYNDPSQMREALAWRLFADAGVPASRHTYARLGIDGVHLGLFSLIEPVDRHFLARRFGDRGRGTLVKVSCGDLGPGTLERRVGPDGDDSGRQYRSDGDDPTYKVRSWSDAGGADSLDDLALLCRVVDGAGLPGGDDRFAADSFGDAVRGILDVEAFLRWAGVNLLVGGWDNYLATPANYYLYNGGGPTEPSFSWIPWDYDNTFGMDYFGTPWQYTDLLDWPAGTQAYWAHAGHHDGRRTRLPLLTNLLAHRPFRRYYLDHLEHLLDTVFAPAAIDRAIAVLWDRVAQSAYLEAPTPWAAPPTGRQYSNDEVYRAGSGQQELRHGETFALGIHHYVLMRYDSARAQLVALRRQDPAGSSGARFPVPVDGLLLGESA
jgi:hypothetical protein